MSPSTRAVLRGYAAPPVNPGTLNEPAGMTVIYNNPGTSISFASGGWTVNTDGHFLDRMSLATGQSNPTGESTVIRMDYPASATIADETRGSLDVDSWSALSGVTIGNISELYVRVRWKLNITTSGGKFFYAGISPEADGDPSTTNSDFYVTQEPEGSAAYAEQATTRTYSDTNRYEGYFRLYGYGGSSSGCLENLATEEGWGDYLNRWLTLEMYLVAESTPGAQDGKAAYWLNGYKLNDIYAPAEHMQAEATAYTHDNLYWSESGRSESSFNGWRWVFCVNQSGSPSAITKQIDWGELYISGKE